MTLETMILQLVMQLARCNFEPTEIACDAVADVTARARAVEAARKAAIDRVHENSQALSAAMAQLAKIAEVVGGAPTGAAGSVAALVAEKERYAAELDAYVSGRKLAASHQELRARFETLDEVTPGDGRLRDRIEALREENADLHDLLEGQSDVAPPRPRRTRRLSGPKLAVVVALHNAPGFRADLGGEGGVVVRAEDGGVVGRGCTVHALLADGVLERTCDPKPAVRLTTAGRMVAEAYARGILVPCAT